MRYSLSLSSSRRLALICVLLSLAAGCGGPHDASVSGTVKLASTPLTRGTVTFIPQGAGAPAYGMIGSDGAYSLRTGSEEGLASGTYTAAVAANETSTASGKDGGPPPLGKSITPEWYRDPATSGLTYTVEPGDNEINIELNNTPPPDWKPPRGR
jgi:hypothetical protein